MVGRGGGQVNLETDSRPSDPGSIPIGKKMEEVRLGSITVQFLGLGAYRNQLGSKTRSRKNTSA